MNNLNIKVAVLERQPVTCMLVMTSYYLTPYCTDHLKKHMLLFISSLMYLIETLQL